MRALQLRPAEPLEDGPDEPSARLCHFADIFSPSLLKRLLKGEGGASRMTVSPTARPDPAKCVLVRLAPDETLILLHPPPPTVGVSIAMERGRQQNDRTLVNG